MVDLVIAIVCVVAVGFAYWLDGEDRKREAARKAKILGRLRQELDKLDG